MTNLNPKGRDIDLKYVFGTIFLCIGMGFICMTFITLFNGTKVYFLGYISPIILISLGIYLMKTSRTSTSIGSGAAGLIFRSYRP